MSIDPTVLSGKLTRLRKEEWLRVLSLLDINLLETLTNPIEHSQRENDALSDVIMIVTALNQSIREAETYRMLPPDLRGFLESDSEAMYTLSRRLTEAVNARDQVNVIRDYLDVVKDSEEKCVKCKIMETVEALLASSFLDPSL